MFLVHEIFINSVYPANSYGRRLFQEMSYHDTPEPPVAEMQYLDRTAKAGEKHTYAVVTINSAGLPTPS